MESVDKGRGIAGFLSVVATVISCVSMVVCIGMSGKVKTDIKKSNGDFAVEVISGGVEDAIYRAEISNGKVVIKNTSGDTVRTLKTPVKFMTEADREYFMAGVDIYSERELMELCDDFER